MVEVDAAAMVAVVEGRMCSRCQMCASVQLCTMNSGGDVTGKAWRVLYPRRKSHEQVVGDSGG
jgi:hypothetical protein